MSPKSLLVAQNSTDWAEKGLKRQRNVFSTIACNNFFDFASEGLQTEKYCERAFRVVKGNT